MMIFLIDENEGHLIVRIRHLIFLFVVLFCIELPGWLGATDVSAFPIRSKGSLVFDVDVCQYEGNGEKTRVEVIYSVYFLKSSLNERDSSQSKLFVHLQMTDENGHEVIINHKEEKKISLVGGEDSEGVTTFYDLKKVELSPRKVVLTLLIQDVTHGKEGRVSQIFDVREFVDYLSLSDLYFASHVQRASEQSAFEKHGILLVPRPSHSFILDSSNDKIYVYYEINHLHYNSATPSFYDAYYRIYDFTGQEIASGSSRQVRALSANTSRIEAIPLGDLGKGDYQLAVEVIDRETAVSCSVASHLQIIVGESERSQVLPMSEEDVVKYFDQIKYIASEEEKRLYKQLDPVGKQEFIFRFWEKRDPDPDTPENGFMIEHFRRLSAVEQLFKGGLNSDMGRVYIQYGPPVDIEREYSRVEREQNVEIWFYGIDGQTKFIFVDRTRDGSYVLVHSTHKDEYKNPDWREALQ